MGPALCLWQNILNSAHTPFSLFADVKFLGGRGLLASGSADRTCRLWRAAGEEDAQYECAHVFRCVWAVPNAWLGLHLSP